MGEQDLSAEAIKEKLATRFIGRNVLYYPSATSTMEIARQEVTRGAPEGTVIIADEQTAGRGRLHRVWIAPKGASVALSVILYPGISELPRFTMMACLAVVRAIRKATTLEPRLKWPNDVLISGKKVCGILIESEVKGETVRFAIVGIGINVNVDPEALRDVIYPATSLSTELGRRVSRVDLVARLLNELEQLYLDLKRGAPIFQEWRSLLDTLGKKIRVRIGDRVEEGCAESVDEDGNLLLRRADGTLLPIVSGDVTLRA